jgi:hypothetical protein
MILILDIINQIRFMEFMEYASFLDSNTHVMASARHFGRLMRRHDNFEKMCKDKTKRCEIERF